MELAIFQQIKLNAYTIKLRNYVPTVQPFPAHGNV